MKLIKWDCLVEMDKLIEQWVKVDTIITDPPYKTTSRWSAWNSWWMLQKKINMKWQVFDNNSIEIKEWLPKCYSLLKETWHLYIMTNNKNIHSYLNTIKDCGFYFIKSLIRVKDNKIMWQYYMWQFEYVLFIRKWKWVKINNCWTSDVLKFNNKKLKWNDKKNLHDTEKPIWLNEVLINNSSKNGDIVLDPFMWIWSCWVACKNLWRHFIWIELDDKYFEIAKKRIEGTNRLF